MSLGLSLQEAEGLSYDRMLVMMATAEYKQTCDGIRRQIEVCQLRANGMSDGRPIQQQIDNLMHKLRNEQALFYGPVPFKVGK